MDKRTVAPYGSWKSPISSRDVAAGNIRLSQPEIDGDDLYWLERRPTEGGRTVVVRTSGGRSEDVTPAGFSVRSRVHEYGGGAYRVFAGELLFSNDADNGLYRQRPGETPTKILAESGLRFADFDRHSSGAWIASVREDHRDPAREARNTIVGVDLVTGAQRVLAQGADFYAYPRFSADGAQIAWIGWNHPNMPWDETQLWLADVGPDMRISGARRLAGHPGESILQPEWDARGGLTFLSDRSWWWNVYRYHRWGIESVTAVEAEVGGPLWGLRTSWYGLDSRGRVVCIVNGGDHQWLAIMDGAPDEPRRIPLPFDSLSGLAVSGNSAVVLAGSPEHENAVIRVDLDTGAIAEVGCSTGARPSATVSMPESISFPGADGETAYGFYYPPCNPAFEAPEGEKAPLVVTCHGGPTGQTSTVFDPEVQFFTSRGFAVLDVDYGGSTGYGRRYRERLTGRMGEVDVDDCVAGALYLAQRGDADPARLVIRGGSAGGYIVLAALTFRDAFAAGASYYGIGDLVQLREVSHKFESRYEEKLIGPYPERLDLFQARSPVLFPEWIRSPVILFQGLEDTVVPPEQAEGMVEALREQRIPYAYLTFEGEGHGFRRAETLKHCLDAELYFYGRVLRFQPAGDLDPVPIVNLDREQL